MTVAAGTVLMGVEIWEVGILMVGGYLEDVLTGGIEDDEIGVDCWCVVVVDCCCVEVVDCCCVVVVVDRCC